MKYVNKMVVIPIEEWERTIKNNSMEQQQQSQEKENPSDITMEDDSKTHEDALSQLLNNNNKFWNEKGEIMSDDGQVVTGSDIVELIKHATVECMVPQVNEPIGILQFYNILKQQNIPQELVRNSKGRELMSRNPYIQKGGEDSDLDESQAKKSKTDDKFDDSDGGWSMKRKIKRKWIIIEDEKDFL
jgi:hypothetical protein